MDTFNNNGSYNKTNWATGDKITSDNLNKIENAIYQINNDYATEQYVQDAIDNAVFGDDVDKYITEDELDAKGYLTEHQSLEDYALKADIPSNVSELNNDAGYLTEHQSLDGLATESYVDNTIGDINTVLDVINGEIIPDDTDEINALLDNINGEVI